ncbi:hypothetical protein ACWCYY_26645 [Kitasatospora sp. NPDC001664]
MTSSSYPASLRTAPGRSAATPNAYRSAPPSRNTSAAHPSRNADCGAARSATTRCGAVDFPGLLDLPDLLDLLDLLGGVMA